MNEHMEDTCTSDLLGYIRSLVLSRIQVNEDQVSLLLFYNGKFVFLCYFSYIKAILRSSIPS